jgi:hypothetical protein
LRNYFHTNFIFFFFFFFYSDEYDSEGSEGSDDEARPLTRTELQSRVMKTVRKRESAAKKDVNKYDLSNAREKTQKSKKDKK